MSVRGKKDDRLFAPFPIEMDEHPKIIGLSDAAFRAVFEATFYSRRMLSDGFLDERVVLRRWGQEVADELSSNDPDRPSWIRVDEPRPGWRIHDFEKHHPLRAEIEASRADLSRKRADAGRKGAATRWQRDSKAVANDGSETETETDSSRDKDPLVGGSGGNGARKTSARGDRIPSPFLVTGEMRAWAAQAFPAVNVDAATEEFVDYWRGVPGAKGRKLDWIATWRNRIRNVSEKHQPTQRPTRGQENLAYLASVIGEQKAIGQ